MAASCFAHPASIDLAESRVLPFEEMTFETARERRKENRTMFLDLQGLRPLLPRK
jgi:hypothetical protein